MTDLPNDNQLSAEKKTELTKRYKSIPFSELSNIVDQLRDFSSDAVPLSTLEETYNFAHAVQAERSKVLGSSERISLKNKLKKLPLQELKEVIQANEVNYADFKANRAQDQAPNDAERRAHQELEAAQNALKEVLKGNRLL